MGDITTHWRFFLLFFLFYQSRGCPFLIGVMAAKDRRRGLVHVEEVIMTMIEDDLVRTWVIYIV
jgi:hypothetical protein